MAVFEGAFSVPRRRRGRDLVLGATMVVALSSALAACGGPSGGKLKVSASSGYPGTFLTLSGEAGGGCTVDSNWFGFTFQRSGAGTNSPAFHMATPVASNGAWAATFIVPSFLGAAVKGGQGALVTNGSYEFRAPNYKGHKVAVVPFNVLSATAPVKKSDYVAIATTTDGQGYWLVQQDGTVSAFGDARYHGSLPVRSGSSSRIVGVARTYDNGGYWLASADGHVYALGDAHPYGSLPMSASRPPVTGIAPTPDGKGYWLLGVDGHVYGFGDAQLDGSPPSNLAPYDAIGTRNAGGYIVTAASDQGVYAYPGGTLTAGGPGTALSATLVASAVSPSGNGTWQAGADGSLVTTGDAGFFGSVLGASVTLSAPITAMVATPDGKGYWLLEANGTVFNYGDAALFNPSPATR
jgi:hypothetical protein